VRGIYAYIYVFYHNVSTIMMSDDICVFKNIMHTGVGPFPLSLGRLICVFLPCLNQDTESSLFESKSHPSIHSYIRSFFND